MYISVMLKTVFDDGQHHIEQIKLALRINEIWFGSMYNAHNFNLHGMLACYCAFCCQKLSITAVFSVKYIYNESGKLFIGILIAKLS